MKILAIHDHSGPKYWRILLPVSGLHHSFKWEVLVTSFVTEQDLEGLDILFFNRSLNVKHDVLLKWRDKYGFKMICDMDDHWVLDKDHPLYHSYKDQDASNKIAWFVANSDAVTVTHERLAEAVSYINDKVVVLPNAIPKVDQFTVKKVPEDYIRLFWAGGITHRRDLELLRRPLQLIKRDGVKFIMGGYDESSPEWREMAKIFTTNSSYNTQVIKMLPVDKYYHTYSLCDISLIPLVDVSFNWYKSNLKILEAANIGAPVVVSEVHPYIGFPDDIVNYVGLRGTWYSQINKLLTSPSMIAEQGAALRDYCDIHYNFEKINQQRKEVFEYVRG
jgi:hypothetical protein